MRFYPVIILTMIALVYTAAPTPAASTPGPDDAVMAPIAGAMAAGQSGNLALLRAQYITTPTIVDEFAPYRWSGTGALSAYFTSYASMTKAVRMTDTKVRTAKPKYLYLSAASAYVLVPVTTTAHVSGKPYTETGVLAFTLQKTSAGWKIATQSWVKTAETFDPYAAR